MNFSFDSISQGVSIISQSGSIIFLGAWIINKLIVQPLQNSITTMKDALNELKELLKDLSSETKDIDKRLVAVEQSSKSTNHRLENLESKIA